MHQKLLYICCTAFSLGSVISKYSDVPVYIKPSGGKKIDPERFSFLSVLFDETALNVGSKSCPSTDYMAVPRGKKNPFPGTAKFLLFAHV